ncbi:hypothetical protein NUU61_001529 [Penicillium alfredii]|uniref:Secreted protein n=1 Tax=Penicillium alfredii TaxID=1506179 RepID=A0A9W9KM61_9EURO|nr:uncharacterized protein NUU61_001529 [Penicillium alfredii]KAJ5111899.1 hypothetical protein NUU61_001529 [Penicillium alfredii]
MHLLAQAILSGVFIGASLGGSLEVIDQDRQCVIWSNDNHGCTGYSASFAELNGTDCSELNEAVNGTRKDFSALNVEACGTENGKDAAWIMVDLTGEVTFFNQNGDKSGCTLNHGLKAGSWCNASDPKHMTTADLSSASTSSTTAMSATMSDFKSKTTTFTSACVSP